MKRLFKLDYEQFLKQIARWNITGLSLNPLIYEESENYYIFYLFTPVVDYCLAIDKNSLTEVNKMNFMEISIPGEMVKDEIKIEPIQEKKPMGKLETFEDQMMGHVNRSIEKARASGFYKENASDKPSD